MALAFWSLLLFCQQPGAEELKPLFGGFSQQPTCGVRSLFVAFKCNGVDINFEELIKPEFVGNGLGSDISELGLAAKRFGVESCQVSGLSDFDLLRINNPVLLHVRSAIIAKEFNHWITYMGSTEGGRFIVFDPVIGEMSISVGELLSIWDGKGLVVGDDSVCHSVQGWGSSSNVFALIIFITIPLFCINSIVENKIKPVQGLGGALLQCLCLLFVVFAISAAFQSMSPVAFWGNRKIVSDILMRYHLSEIEEVSRIDVVKLIGEDALLVDARYGADFNAMTIPGAINLPLNATIEYQRNFIEKVERTKTIIVFCKSSDCFFSDEVAKFLELNGYSNILIYREGLVDWLQEF